MVIGAACVGYLYWQFAPTEPAALQAFINANVLTVNSSNQRAEAVLIEGDTIAAIGTTKEITALIQAHPARDSVVVTDLAGRTLMPGIVDAHSHFPGSGVYEFAADLNSPPIGDLRSIGDVQARLRSLVAGKADGEWVFGLGYDDSLLSEARHPMRQELDAVSTRHPIFILHVSGHLGVANSAALRALGLEKSGARPSEKAAANADYLKNRNGQLTGVILESAVLPLLQRATDFSLTETYQVVQRAAKEYAQQGVTSVQNGAADKRNAQGLEWASRLGLVQQRVVIWPTHGALNAEEAKQLKLKVTGKFQVGAIKLVADGSIQGYTGYLSKPYHVQPKHFGPAEEQVIRDGNAVITQRYRGKPVLSRDQLTTLVSDYFEQGQQLAIHGNGDASIDDILYAVELALQNHPFEDHRTVLVHAQMAREDQLKKMLKLGVTPSFFSAHTFYWGDRHRAIFIGADRANAISPARTAERLGLPFSIHLDTPVVPMKPMRLLWSAVNRETSSGRVLGRRERLSRDQAIRAITIDAAYQVFKDKKLGSVEVGKLADLVVLSADPSDQSTDLLSVKVLRTYVGGVPIYTHAEAKN